MNFSGRRVDYDAFKALNDAYLVFDGRLVIDAGFHTNDPIIRAAGPLTKFARSYHAEHLCHAEFSPKDVGVELAGVLLPLLDPTLEPELEPEPSRGADPDELIPVYAQPKTRGAKLPGGYSYLHVTKPAANTPLTSSTAPTRYVGTGWSSKAAFGPIFLSVLYQGGVTDLTGVTGAAETGDYFRLFLNQYGLVESITCFSKEPIPVSNYLCLYGKHELLLNRLCARFDEGLIRDLYSYFKERWCLAIYHDRFVDFEEEVRQIMKSATVEGEDDLLSVHELIQKMVEEELVISEDPNVYLQNVFAKSDGLAPLKRGVLNYLKYNRYHLTMYAQPESM
ncbi:hypothetical protein AAFF_G00120750 [Aldrovandia affinis]|uniref:CFAP61 dimerisation domain-containing protein n=1 Tax=Aldrovandia affinis TaxID=143900 RepID=A0AAD7W9Z3_9TELE|nr:hypothetical protein AAFF_G00120750 [Aldrovandia affinis]